MQHPIVLDYRGKIKKTSFIFDKNRLNEIYKIINNTPLQVTSIYMAEEDYIDIVEFGKDLKK